jgi:hypothetical protein
VKSSKGLGLIRALFWAKYHDVLHKILQDYGTSPSDWDTRRCSCGRSQRHFRAHAHSHRHFRAHAHSDDFDDIASKLCSINRV